MNAVASLRRHPIYRDALICQLVVFFVLTPMIDGVDIFALIMLPALVLYWVGLMFFVRFRVTPSKPELLVARFGSLFVFILVFVIGQYL
jgi:hypothetical protein